MRIWVDMTAPAHPIVLRPVIERLREQGHDVSVTARDYAQTLAILERLRISHTRIGAHPGASRARKARALATRTARMIRWGAPRRFDLAIAHGSNDLALASAALRIPEVNTFDYEWARTQHRIGCRIATIVLVPEAIPPERLAPYGATAAKLRRYAGLKEEYYLADFEPDATVVPSLGVDATRTVVVLRPPPEVSMYHATNELFPQVVRTLGAREDVHAVVIPRTREQREQLARLGLASLIVPADAVDAQSLIAAADLVVSAGGTMNREAVALGTPVLTTFAGRLGGVDEALIAEGRLTALTSVEQLEPALRKRDGAAPDRVRRDPAQLAAFCLEAVPR